jgi:hypothetical protein
MSAPLHLAWNGSLEQQTLEINLKLILLGMNKFINRKNNSLLNWFVLMKNTKKTFKKLLHDWLEE